MNFARATHEEIFFQAGLRINNSLNDAKVLSAVSAMSYTEEKLKKGAELLEQAIKLYETKKKEYGELGAAQAAFDAERIKVNRTYMDMLQICRVALKNDVKAIATLELSGRRARTFSGWLKQVTGFYRAILASKKWKTALATYGQSVEKLTAQLEAVEKVGLASETVKSEKGDAQNATRQRDEKIEELVEWITDYTVIARIALANKPQLLEKLGIVV